VLIKPRQAGILSSNDVYWGVCAADEIVGSGVGIAMKVLVFAFASGGEYAFD
jgi:hypothetical protein